MASGPQRCGAEMDATISTALEPGPRPFTGQGHLASSNVAGQGEVWGCKSVAMVARPREHFGGRRAAPVWGP